MLRLARAVVAHPIYRHPNTHAVAISFAAISVLYIQFEPLPAGAETYVSHAAARITIPDVPLTAPLAAAAPTNSPSSAPLPQTDDPLQLEIALLEQGLERIKQVPDYTAQFFKQERIGGSLSEEQVMLLKIRHAPFSIYLKWLVGDTGREVLYVEGENDGQMIVHAGGWKARLIPALKLDPTGSLAMRESRHPVTEAGLKELAETVLEHRQLARAHNIALRSRLIEGQQFDGRGCYCFVVEFPSQAVSEVYRKSIVLIDKEYRLPVCIKNYTWPDADAPNDPAALDDATLIEFYSYSDVRFDRRLADIDFDKSNTEYTFRR